MKSNENKSTRNILAEIDNQFSSQLLPMLCFIAVYLTFWLIGHYLLVFDADYWQMFWGTFASFVGAYISLRVYLMRI
jgi:hypothetical protein